MPRKAPFSIAFDLPFDEAIEAARARKSVLPDAYYHQLPAEARRLAFTVSGLTALDQVQGVLDRMGRHIEDGGTFADFKRLAASQPWELPKHRLETIFRNAVQTAYGAGHWRRFEETKDDQPYLMYDAVNDSRTRPAHRALDGIIRPVDDPFWLTHSPPMGHNCRCTLIQLDAEQAEIRSRNGRGLNQPETPEMRGDDDGWGRRPTDTFAGVQSAIKSRLAQCDTFTTFGRKRTEPPIWCNDGPARELLLMQRAWVERKGQMPEPRPLVLEPLRYDSPEQAFAQFMRQFGGESMARVGLPSGDEVIVSDDLFRRLNGEWKIEKRGRAQWLLYLSELILRPQEVWLRSRGGSEELYLLGRFKRGSQRIDTIAAFARPGGDVGSWVGRTAYAADRKDYLSDKRARLIKESAKVLWLEL